MDLGSAALSVLISVAMNSIHTPSALQIFLESHGYATRTTEHSVLISLGGAGQSHLVAFTFKEDELVITCQLAMLGDFPEAKLASLCLGALDANMQISPYAFAVIGAGEGEVALHETPLVLTDTLPTSDLSEAELAFALEKLREALEYSREILTLGKAVQ